MKFKSLIFLLIFTVTISCHTNSDTEKVADFFNQHYPENDLIAEVDLSKTDSTLVKDFEDQLGIDMCINPFISGKFNYQNLEINFPIYIFKHCGWLRAYPKSIPIMINKENRVLADYRLVEADEKLTNVILKCIKERENKSLGKQTIFLVEWQKELEPEKLKNRIFQILESILIWFEQMAKEEYGKEISKLNKQEMKNLNKQFYGVIGFNDHRNYPVKNTSAK